ncbi:DUF6678 family protein [Rhodovulum sp. DZ06]|uniref:DUF6678 family protein n=1 Tax=Rhodovulum sp. DZ06 TaxID=3425126 RepID=UPI003D34CA6C
MDDQDLRPVMNRTKWDELRLAMCALGGPPYRTMATNGHYAPIDREWVHHFRCPGAKGGWYGYCRHVDIFASEVAGVEEIRAALAAIHVPGARIENGWRVYGWTGPGQDVDWIA